MPDNIMSEYLQSSLEGIRNIAGMDTIIGNAINTPSGVTVIPVSRVTMGFASGSLDIGTKRIGANAGIGGGGGTGVSITPVAFLAIGKDADIRLIPIADAQDKIDKITSLLEKAPEMIERIKGKFK